MRKEEKAIVGIVLTVFLTGILTLALDVQPAQAVIDDSQMLIVFPGETYTKHDSTAYTKCVVIMGTLYVTPYDGPGTKGTLELYAPVIAVGKNGNIDADSAGFRNNEGLGTGQLNDMTGGAGGAGYGGNGGDGGGSPGDGGSSYGTTSGSDIERGSGGADSHGGAETKKGGDGGGFVLLNGADITIRGTVTANGFKGQDAAGGWAAGGGSGGGIKIDGQNVMINGTLSVEGGAGGTGSWCGGGGAGGRIKIFANLLSTEGSTISYGGGSGGSGDFPGGNGEDGTFYVEYEFGPSGIPALTEWGMIVLFVLLVGAGIMVLRQRRRATA